MIALSIVNCFASNSLNAVSICSPPKADEVLATRASQTDQSPFDWLSDIPMAIDVAAVFNNPAEQFLLNDSGRSIRKLLATAGVFNQTEHAWDALANAFDAETDATIKALLGKKVIVVWDGVDQSTDSMLDFANAFDNHWTLVCEVEPDYLIEIQSQLKPVRRRIEHGQSVYAIEKGRYEIVLLSNEQDNQRSALVLLAPKKGSQLMGHVLSSIAAHHPHTQPHNTIAQEVEQTHHSILHNRSDLIASIDSDKDWSLAWMIQIDRLDGNQEPTPHPSPVVAGLMSATDQGFAMSFATDLELDIGEADAPVGLLSAVGSDAILAIAMASSPKFFYDDNLLGMMYNAQLRASTDSDQENSQTQLPPDKSNYPDGPGLILLSQAPSVQNSSTRPQSSLPSIALTVLTQLEIPRQSHTPLAKRVDQTMHDLFSSFSQAGAPDCQGRFPSAVRTHTFDSPETVPELSSPTNSNSWPGDQTKFSWITNDIPGAPSLVTSLGPSHTDTAKQVRWIAEAAQKFQSIPNHAEPSGVITAGYFSPARTITLLESVSTMDLAISKLIERIEWNISRSSFGYRGTASIEFSDYANLSKLGKDRPQ